MSNENSIILSGTDPDLPRNIPQGLGRYSGFREMAHGATACLRSSFDPVTGRTVAIKTLLPQARGDKRERRRLLREARVTAQLQHPNTVPVYDIGDDEKEGIYFVMKRISGENFFEILKRIARQDEATVEAFPQSRRLEIVADACQALAYAHVRGVIHRDVKPENIWVGNFGEVILLDWGVAKVWGHADDNEPVRKSVLRTPANSEAQSSEGKPAEDQSLEAPSSEAELAEAQASKAQLQTLTGGGQRPGTPLYMSPEQIDGNRGIDERSDVFSAGVCLYETLAIREPFRGATIDETFENIRARQVCPPSERSPERGISAEADAVVMRALQKRPGDRYQSMRDLIADIRKISHFADSR